MSPNAWQGRGLRGAGRGIVTGMAVAAWMLSAAALAQPADWPHPGEMSFDPVEFEPLEPRREVLDNGLVVYLAEDPELPLVQGTAYVDAPALFDPPDKTGLSAFTANLLREGGAGGRAPDELNEELEFLGARVEASADDALASVSFSALQDNVGEVLPIWRDVLIAPDFAPERVEVQRQRQLESIRRVADQPVQLAVREFQARVAEGHPAGAYPTEATIESITREDLRAFHQAYYAPSSTVLAVTGDFDADEMLARLERVFGDWRHQAEPPPELPTFDPDPEAKVYLAQKDVQQSVIIAGTPAMPAYDAPYTAFTAANHVLGAGGFTSRLFQEIRSRRGLAYATGSVLTQGFEVPGVFLAYAFTRADATGQTLQLLLDELRRMHQEGPTPDELARGVETLVNQSLFRDTSVAARTERTARVELLGLPADYFERHLERLRSLSVDEARDAVRDVYDPENLVILVLGDEQSFDLPLEDFGPVERIEVE